MILYFFKRSSESSAKLLKCYLSKFVDFLLLLVLLRRYKLPHRQPVELEIFKFSPTFFPRYGAWLYGIGSFLGISAFILLRLKYEVTMPMRGNKGIVIGFKG